MFMPNDIATRNRDCCGHCRWWSQLIAYADAEGLHAACLNEANPEFGTRDEDLDQRYTLTDHTCAHFEYGEYAVDDPFHWANEED